MKEDLIQQIGKQNIETIGPFLNSLCSHGYYTERIEDLTPMLQGKVVYVVGTDDYIIPILIDTDRPFGKDTLTDEEKFNEDTEPLWFEENHHRVSPVYRLMQFAHAIRQLCRIYGKMQPSVHCVLLSQAYLINFEDQKPLYDFLRVTVFHHMPGLLNFSMATGSGQSTPAAQLMKDYKEHMNVLSWEPEEKFDRVAEEFLRESVPPTVETKEAKKAESTHDADSLSFLDGDDDLDVDNVELPDLGALRAELIAPMPRSQAVKQLENLVGCQQLKQFVCDMCNLAEYNRRLTHIDSKAKTIPLCLNTVFMGNPGTAKTTAARLLGSLLRGRILSKGHVIMASRSTFVGQNWGMEEERVERLFEASAGGVLVIDEAYMLMGAGHKDDPAKLVLPLMLSKLADERENDRMVILCGYRKPMMQLLDTNPGLTSRFPTANRFDFKDLNTEELVEVFRRRLHDYGDYQLTRKANVQVKEIIKNAYMNRDKTTFGNGRYVVNLLNAIIREHSNRVVKNNIMERKQLYLLTAADVKPLEMPEKSQSVGFR